MLNRQEYSKQYYIKNREKILEQTKQYNIEHKDEKLKYQHEHYKKNRLDRLKYSKKYHQLYPEVNKHSDEKRINKLRIIMKQLKINGCSICGYNKCMRALEFHHVNPKEKDFQVILHKLKFKDDKIVNELNKCILLCSNCHREITAKEKGDYRA